MEKVTLTEIARALGVTVGRASQMKKAGMPIDTITAAMAWKAARVQVQFQDHTHRQNKGHQDLLTAQAYDLQKARAKREHHEARIAEMKERQLAGELVELDKVKKALADTVALIRHALERIPDKLADRMAAESDPVKNHAMLMQEINQVLDDLAASAVHLFEDENGRH